MRTVAEEISRASDNVFYFPSFEIALFSKSNNFIDDERHIKPVFADGVIESFWNAFS